MVEVLILAAVVVLVGSVLYLPAMIAVSKKRYILTIAMFGFMVLGLHTYEYDKTLSVAIVVIVWIISLITALLIEPLGKKA